MNSLEKHLKAIDTSLFSKFQETKSEVDLLLQKYSSNFQEYTDHSSSHTLEVFKIASELLTEEEIQLLEGDETYILAMACLLHDIGMCIPEKKIKEISNSEEILAYKESHPNLSNEEYIRNIHHSLSNKFINEEWEFLKIPTRKYAVAIGLVAEGHRKVDLGDFDNYDPEFFAKSGKETVCLPYLACILRIADELDVTNSRTPKLLTKYYMPNNKTSIREWLKHMSTSQRNYKNNLVLFEVDCSDQNIYAALQDQFDKIQNVINYSQKIIRSIPPIKGKSYKLNLSNVEVKYNFIGFNPKGIKFSFDVQNVVTAFIGEELYNDKMTSLREAIQNSIDSCRYKSKVQKENYIPFIKIIVTNEFISVEDNGAGMDEFIIENFFGRLASSFYEQEKIKNQFEAIGQFGVGVFSYFLMSEYIDIETKTISSPALKFRFDRDPKNYFHFYDKVERENPGTTIKLYLKEDFKGKLTDDITEGYIRKIFRHIEIPIELELKDKKVKIENVDFQIDRTAEIKGMLKFQEREKFKNFKTESIYINDQNVEGFSNLIIAKNYLKTFSYSSVYFDGEAFITKSGRGYRDMTKFSISQKGVFVNNYSSSTLNLFFGDINLKRKIKINIDRNEFSDEKQVFGIINQFTIKTLEKLFSSLESKYKNKEEAQIVTNDFINNYFNFYLSVSDPNFDNFSKILQEFLYVKIYFNSTVSIIKFKELLTHKEFMLISDKENHETVSKIYNKPIIIAQGYGYIGLYRQFQFIIEKLLKHEPEMHFFDNKGYLIFFSGNKKNDEDLFDSYREILGYSFDSVLNSNSKKIILSQWANKKEFVGFHDEDLLALNMNHWFYKFLISQKKDIKSQEDGLKVVQSIIEIIRDLVREKKDKSKLIKKINQISEQFRLLKGFQKFKVTDF